ncbi:hypothetical protein IMG5_061800, partial [Ichthyophthirius multifiliis]
MNIIDQFQNIWKQFCKPIRQNYSLFDLGPPIFQNDFCQYKRTDFQLQNKKNQEIVCSIYENPTIQSKYCILYLHSLNGSRIESKHIVQYAIQNGFSFVSFDFPGCGLSQGDYVTLGYSEQNDVEIIINYIKEVKKIPYISLWGRSMGAVTALLYSQKFPQNINCMAVDSPFLNIKSAGINIIKQKIDLPEFLLGRVMEFVRGQIKNNLDFDIEDVDCEKNLNNSSVPAIFIVSKEDKLISCENLNNRLNLTINIKNFNQKNNLFFQKIQLKIIQKITNLIIIRKYIKKMMRKIINKIQYKIIINKQLMIIIQIKMIIIANNIITKIFVLILIKIIIIIIIIIKIIIKIIIIIIFFKIFKKKMIIIITRINQIIKILQIIIALIFIKILKLVQVVQIIKIHSLIKT